MSQLWILKYHTKTASRGLNEVSSYVFSPLITLHARNCWIKNVELYGSWWSNNTSTYLGVSGELMWINLLSCDVVWFLKEDLPETKKLIIITWTTTTMTSLGTETDKDTSSNPIISPHDEFQIPSIDDVPHIWLIIDIARYMPQEECERVFKVIMPELSSVYELVMDRERGEGSTRAYEDDVSILLLFSERASSRALSRCLCEGCEWYEWSLQFVFGFDHTRVPLSRGGVQ